RYRRQQLPAFRHQPEFRRAGRFERASAPGNHSDLCRSRAWLVSDGTGDRDRGLTRAIPHQRSGWRHTEYQRPRFFSFHCGSAQLLFSSSGDMVTPTLAGSPSEHALASSTAAKTTKTALTRAPLWGQPCSASTIGDDYLTPI